MASSIRRLQLFAVFLSHVLGARGNVLQSLRNSMSPHVLNAIERVITQEKKCMAIFDFGGALSHGRLTTAILYYQIEHMNFAFTPEQFHQAFYFSTSDTKHCLESDILAVDDKGNTIPSANFYATLHGLYKNLYDLKQVKSLDDIKRMEHFQQFRLLMLFYHQQFARMAAENRECKRLLIYQVSRWWIYMPIEAVKTLAYEAGKYSAAKNEKVKVGGIVIIRKQRAHVEYAFDFALYEAPVELIRILNEHDIHTSILTGAEHTMIAYYNEQAIHAKHTYGAQCTHNESESTVEGISKAYAQNPLELAIFAGFVKPDTIPPIAVGKYKIVEQMMEIHGLEPCIVLADSVSDYGMLLSMTEGIVIAIEKAGSFPIHDALMKYHSGVQDHHGPIRVYKQYIKEGKWMPYDNLVDH